MKAEEFVVKTLRKTLEQLEEEKEKLLREIARLEENIGDFSRYIEESSVEIATLEEALRGGCLRPLTQKILEDKKVTLLQLLDMKRRLLGKNREELLQMEGKLAGVREKIKAVFLDLGELSQGES